MQSAISYSPDTTHCSTCRSSGEYYIRVKKAAKKADFYGSEEGTKAQEAQSDGIPWDPFED